ncbi:MAG: DNA recombination protein RmuC [Mariprofundaceae bacterium]
MSATGLLVILVAISIILLMAALLLIQRQSRKADQVQDMLLARISEITESKQRLLSENLRDAMSGSQQRITDSVQQSMKGSTDTLNKQFDRLMKTVDGKLDRISGRVDERLDKGFEKTQKVFADVLTRLSLIDKAQERIAQLSENVVSLQDVLTDKRARGAFGEVQLHQLVQQALPASAFEMQATLSNGRRVDCLIKLPEPIGYMGVDSKFSLENYQRSVNPDLSEAERTQAAAQFKQDIKKHIDDIADRYIIPGETTDGAIMFLPSEAVFAELHARHEAVVAHAQRRRVWVASPTTMMAILTTVAAALKDAETRKQVHIIQEHLRKLSEDFGRFGVRFDKLATHIRQAHEDTEQIHKSAKKISSQFEKIEKVELEDAQKLPREDS